MAGKLKFEESAFRAQLLDSLRDVTVSDALRVKTLDACRSLMQEEELAGSRRIDDGKSTSGKRILSFPARHATVLRIAGGIAACVLLAVILVDLVPKSGRQDSSLAFADRSISENATIDAASDNNAESGMSSMETAPEARLAKSVTPEAPAGADTAETYAAARVAEAQVVPGSADAQAVSGPAETTGSDSSTDPAALAAAPEALRASAGGYMSWGGGTWSEPILPEPNAGILLSAADEYEAAHPGTDLYPERIFAATHLKTALTADVMSQSTMWKDLSGTTGIWMIPAQTGVGWSVFPVLTGPAESSAIQTHFGEELATQSGQDWLFALADEVSLRQVLEKAAGVKVESWTILDVQGGKGYWVCWTVNGNDWVMPFMDAPEALNLNNGTAYPYGLLKETVIPLL